MAGEARAAGDGTGPRCWHTEGVSGWPEGGRGRDHRPPGERRPRTRRACPLSLSLPRMSCCPRAGDPMKRLGSQGSGQRRPGVRGPSKGTLTSSMPAGPKGSTRSGSLGGPAWGQPLPKCEEGLGPAGRPGDWTQRDRHSCLFRRDRGNVADTATHLLCDLRPAAPRSGPRFPSCETGSPTAPTAGPRL